MYYNRNEWQRNLLLSQLKSLERALRVHTKVEPLLPKVSKKTSLPLSHQLPLSHDNLLPSPCGVLTGNTELAQLCVCWGYSMCPLTSLTGQGRNSGIKCDSHLPSLQSSSCHFTTSLSPLHTLPHHTLLTPWPILLLLLSMPLSGLCGPPRHALAMTSGRLLWFAMYGTETSPLFT